MDTVMTRFGRGTLRATSHSRHPLLSNAGDSCCRMFISEPCILNLCEVTSPKFSGIPLLEFSASYDARGLVGLSAGVDPAGLCAICREGREVRELAFQLAQQLVSFRSCPGLDDEFSRQRIYRRTTANRGRSLCVWNCVGWQSFGKMLLVFGCIGSDFCKKICVLQHFSKSSRFSS